MTVERQSPVAYGSLDCAVLLSGGIDSLACAHFLKHQDANVSGLHFSFGQPAQELECKAAKEVADHLNINLAVIEISGYQLFNVGEIRGRNLALISIALMFAPIKSGGLAIGIHAGTQYYDCSIHFLDSASALASNCSGGRIELLAPFVSWSKSDIFSYARQQNLPLDLSYSCEVGGREPCERCLSCKDRKWLEC